MDVHDLYDVDSLVLAAANGIGSHGEIVDASEDEDVVAPGAQRARQAQRVDLGARSRAGRERVHGQEEARVF
jgi:hypothetical protein